MGKRMKGLLVGCTTHSRYRDWSALPMDVVSCIMDKITHPEDYVRFGAAVCPPWRDVFLEEISSGRRPSCCRLPFLLVAAPPPPPPQEVDHQQRAIYSLSRRRVCDFRLPVPHNKICRGSSLGWLITLETRAPQDCTLQLHNPFLNCIIHLPPPGDILKLHPDDPWRHDLTQQRLGLNPYDVWKAVLSSDPLSSPNNYLVMAIMSGYYGLAFYKPGNTTWTSVGDWFSQFKSRIEFNDVIYFSKARQFYALSTGGEVFAVDFSSDDRNPKLTQVAPSPRFDASVMYLVEDLSSGDLYQAYKDNKSDNRHPERVVFTVFKFHTSNQNWTLVENLGENVMFLGNNGSLLRSASECPGCEPNCIYYTDDDDTTHRLNFDSCGLPWDGVYCLDNGTVRPHYSCTWPQMTMPRKRSALARKRETFTYSTKLLPQAIWLEPTISSSPP